MSTNRHDATGDTEHVQECAQFVYPEGAKHVANEVAQQHNPRFGRVRALNVSRERPGMVIRVVKEVGSEKVGRQAGD
jgi:hypothetical protein